MKMLLFIITLFSVNAFAYDIKTEIENFKRYILIFERPEENEVYAQCLDSKSFRSYSEKSKQCRRLFRKSILRDYPYLLKATKHIQDYCFKNKTFLSLTQRIVCSKIVHTVNQATEVLVYTNKEYLDDSDFFDGLEHYLSKYRLNSNINSAEREIESILME
jgi:hypothetical protein